MTTNPQPLRIPIGRNITYVVRGMPEVPNAYGPGYLVPTEISLTYRATEDSQLGRFHAYVKGQWRRDGEVMPSGEKLPGQHYYGDPSTWPAWLAEEARLHDPAASAVVAVAAPPTGQTAEVRLELARVLHELHLRAEFDATEDVDAVLAVLAPPADRAAVLAEAIATLEQVRDTKDVNVAVYPRYDQHQQRALDAGISVLRRLADEAQQQPETQAGDTAQLAKVARWVTSEPVTANTEFGNGYRECQRDIRDLLKGRFDYDPRPAVVSAVPPQPEDPS